jgi:hypothetical protein
MYILCELRDIKYGVKCNEKETTAAQCSALIWTIRWNRWKDKFASEVKVKNRARDTCVIDYARHIMELCIGKRR